MLPSSTNSQYLSLITSNDIIRNTIRDMGYNEEAKTINCIKRKIDIGNIDLKNTSQNVFDVTVSADNPEESLKLAKTLYSNYIKYIDIITRQKAIDYFYDSLYAQLQTNEDNLSNVKEILKKNEELLVETPDTIDQGSLAGVGSGTAIENIINPAYEVLQNSIVENKQSINSIEQCIKTISDHLKELETEKKSVEEYYITGETGDSASSGINIIKTSIYLLAEPVAPTDKTSPNNTINTIMGLIIGGIFAAGIVLIKEYWFIK